MDFGSKPMIRKLKCIMHHKRYFLHHPCIFHEMEDFPKVPILRYLFGFQKGRADMPVPSPN